MRFQPTLIILLVLLSACNPLVDEETATAAPSATATATITALPSRTALPSPTHTSSPTVTPTHSPTPTPTTSPTLQTAVLQQHVGLSDIPAAANGRPVAIDTPTLPPLREPLPNATLSRPPYTGWHTFESDHPAVTYQGDWQGLLSRAASRGQYHYTVDPGASAQLSFSGSALRVRYVAFRNGGTWQLVVDGIPLATIDSYAPQGRFIGTELFVLPAGDHELLIRPLPHSNPASSGSMVALDAVQVYRPLPTSPTPTPLITAHPSPTPRAAVVELLRSAPTLQPTTTPQPAVQVQVTVIIAYDAHTNRAVDPAEGVQGIPVRLVEPGSNQVLTTGFTDEAGVVQLQAVTNQTVRAVVPYLGAYWEMRANGTPQTITLLLPAGNQPGLIP